MQLLLYCKGRHKWPPLNLKFFLAMKMLSLLLSVACLELGATGYSQEITISLKNASLDKVFKQIENQTTFRFLYSKEAIDQAHPVTIEVKNETLENVLRICFTNQPISYSIEEKFIIVKIPEEKKKVIDLFHDVKGKVVNENGEPVAGATITAKKSNKATFTNERGEFSLKAIDDDDIINITSIGYYKEELQVNNQTFFLVTLRIAIASLDETIIRGYYTTSRRLNTGAVSKINSKDIGTQPVSNPLAALQARVPGLLITQANGLPGSNFTVRIRGNNSIQNGNSPFYVIDGVPFVNDADVLTQRSQINASSPFNTINPSDIESIEVLKDADATAIYGSRGANGVILITTKKGKPGKTKVNLNAYSGWGKVTRTIRFLNTEEYLQMRKEAFANDAVTPSASNAYDLLVWDTTRYANLQKQLTGGTAHTDNVILQISGGTINTNFSAGGNYYRETTVFPGNNSDQRATVHFALFHQTADGKFQMNLSSSLATDRGDLIRADLTQFINLPPDIPELFDSLGHLNWSKGGFSFTNPLSNSFRKYKVVTDRLTYNLNLRYNFLKGLNLNTNFGFNELWTDETDKVPIASQDPSITPTGTAFFGNNNIRSWIIEPQLNYSCKVGNKGKFQTLVGVTLQENSGKRTAITGTGYTNDNLLNSTLGAQTVLTNNVNDLYHYAAVFGRVNYNWDEKYLVNCTGRRDGSSRFGSGKQFANFAAIGTGWVFSNEKLFKKHFSFISFGKLRFSYGPTGNDLIGNYQYLDSYSPTRYPYQGIPSLFPSRLYNEDYSWEQIRKLNFGLDLGFIQDRILITVDYFKNKSDNQIIYYSLPGQTGFSSVLQNFPGVVQNSGWELQINSNNVKAKDFNWSTFFNLTFSRNKLLTFPGLEGSSYAYRYLIGKPLNTYIGAKYAGVDPTTGVYQFYDKNHNLSFSPGTSDYQYTGTTDPKFYGGIQNDAKWKNWELVFLFEFKKQMGIHPIYSRVSLVGDAFNQPSQVLDRWQKAGDIATYEKFTQTFGVAGNAILPVYNSSAILTDASFIRLKNLSLSYSLPVSMLTKKGIENIRIFLEGQNLFLITRYKGADPETQSNMSLPPLKMFVAGLQIIF
jgi:TonB-linked SusC/RagA family outer membrane protein